MNKKIAALFFVGVILIGLVVLFFNLSRPYFTRSRVNAAIEAAKQPISSIDLLTALSPYDRCPDVLDALWEAAISNDLTRKENAGYWLSMIGSGHFPIGDALRLSVEEESFELRSFLLRKRETALDPVQQQMLARFEMLLKENER